jgi:hypothetical protein
VLSKQHKILLSSSVMVAVECSATICRIAQCSLARHRHFGLCPGLDIFCTQSCCLQRQTLRRTICNYIYNKCYFTMCRYDTLYTTAAHCSYLTPPLHTHSHSDTKNTLGLSLRKSMGAVRLRKQEERQIHYVMRQTN